MDGFLGPVHCGRERAHMVGHRADMGEVLLVLDQPSPHGLHVAAP